MFEFLVTSKTRRRLLMLLWADTASGTAPELARRAHVSLPGAYAELATMRRLGLVTVERRAGADVYRANEQHPQAPHLRGLMASPSTGPRSDLDDRAVRLQLRALGAPLAVSGEAPPASTVEEVLARGLKLAHRDPGVAKSLPVCLWENRDRLDPGRLRRSAQAVGEKQALGFFLELTSTLSGDERFRAWTAQLRDHRVRRLRAFFDTTGSRAWKALAEQSTPSAARRWSFLMNMDEETFRSHFRKFVGELDEDVPT